MTGTQTIEPNRVGPRPSERVPARMNALVPAADDPLRVGVPALVLHAGGLVFAMFVVPTAMAFFYSLTRWTLFDWEFIGLDNFRPVLP